MGQEPGTSRFALRALIKKRPLAAVFLVASALQFSPVAAQNRGGNGTPPEPPKSSYEDRVIEGLAPAVSEDEARAKLYNAEGWVRALKVEARLATLPFQERNRGTGFNITAFLETPNYGVLSVDTNYAPEIGRNTWVVRQRAVPVPGGWLVNNEAGVTAPLALGIMRQTTRVFVPAMVERGIKTEWLNAGDGVLWSASTGQPGRMEGFPVAGFQSLSGRNSHFSVQFRESEWIWAARHLHARNVSPIGVPVGSSETVDANSTQVALRNESGPRLIQVNAISTRSSLTTGSRTGVWADAEWKLGPTQHSFGLFRLEPDLTWGGQTMASDIEGAFLRGSWRTRQWSAEGGIDFLRSVSGITESGVFATASGRYRYSRDLVLGAGINVRRYSGNGRTGYLDARWQNAWGTTGLRADLSTPINGERIQRLTLDQGWALTTGWSLNTSFMGGRETTTQSSGALWGGAISLTAPLTSNATLTGSATTERHANGDSTSSLNASLLWQITPNWSLEGNIVQSYGKVTETFLLDPLAPPPERMRTDTNTRSAFVLVRYEDRAGARTAPLGGRPMDGGGNIEGIVYLDANRSGRQEAGEQGASGVTVYLDGRYAARTDSQGRFEFPFVAPGNRTITVLDETLPLPWSSGDKAQIRVDVRVRETIRIEIPVIRRGERGDD
jgi:hypothetical protein